MNFMMSELHLNKALKKENIVFKLVVNFQGNIIHKIYLQINLHQILLHKFFHDYEDTLDLFRPSKS